MQKESCASILASMSTSFSAPLHGADDLDLVAVVERRRRPGVAAHDRAVERDRKAFRIGQVERGGLRPPQLGEIAARAHARLTIDVEPHGLAPQVVDWSA